MFFTLIFLYHILGQNHAAPTRNSIPRDVLQTFADSSNYVCPVKERTAVDIIWSCLATIFFCSWVAVHPNIPALEAGKWRRALTRLELMAWTIIAPEFIIFWAMRQWYAARHMQASMKEVYPGWTKTHGYFVQMGGFVLYDAGIPKQVLDHYSLCFLFKQVKIMSFDVTKTDIEDRSKGDALSKAFVVGQTTWFVTQCISRRAQSLATTELELIALAFSLLNVFMYFFWWDKPLDVRTPVRVYLKSDLSDVDKDIILFSVRNIAWFIESTNVLKTPVTFTESKNRVMNSNPSRHDSRDISDKSKTLAASLYQWLIKAIKAVYQRLLDMSVFLHFQDSEKMGSGSTHVHIFYACCPYQAQAEKMLAMVSMIAILFGGIHCAGWNFEFPSTTEAFLWRISSLIVTIAPLLMEVRFLLYNPTTPVERRYRAPRLQKLAWSITIYIALPFYLLSRVILLVEAVITLRHISPSALATVQWASFLPHV